MKNIKNILDVETPKVTILKHTGIGVSELSARTCYDSFESSENLCIKNFNNTKKIKDLKSINEIESSDLLEKLSWVHHHHSILEHTNISYLVEGTSRGVLQEHARHRIQAISVRSTRYTMQPIINAFIASMKENVSDYNSFEDLILLQDIFVTRNKEYNAMQIKDIHNKMIFLYNNLGIVDFFSESLSKSALNYYNEFIMFEDSYKIKFKLLNECKTKRNVGDLFKHIVNDNWKVDMVVTFNLRSLKNYFNLRLPNSAYYQIQMLANEMKNATPEKYLKLILKDFKN